MKKLLSILVLLNFVATLVLPDLLQATTAPLKVYTLAVLKLQPRGELKAAEALELTKELDRKLGEINFIQTLSMQAVNLEQVEYCSSLRCALRIGSSLEAEFIVYGIVHQIGDFYACEFRLANVHTGKLVGSASYKFDGNFVMIRAQIQNLSRKLLGLEITDDMPISTRTFAQAEKDNAERKRKEKAKEQAIEKLNEQITDDDWQTNQNENFESTEWLNDTREQTQQASQAELARQDSIEIVNFNSFSDNAAPAYNDEVSYSAMDEFGYDETGDMLGDADFTLNQSASPQDGALIENDFPENDAIDSNDNGIQDPAYAQQNNTQPDTLGLASQPENARRTAYKPPAKKKELIEITWDENKDLDGGEETYQLDSFEIAGQENQTRIREKQINDPDNTLNENIWADYVDTSSRRKRPVKKSREELIAEREAQSASAADTGLDDVTSTNASANKVNELFPEYTESNQGTTPALQATGGQAEVSNDGFPDAEFLTDEKKSTQSTEDSSGRKFRIGKVGVYSIIATGVGTGLFFAVKNLGQSNDKGDNGPPLPRPPAFLGND